MPSLDRALIDPVLRASDPRLRLARTEDHATFAELLEGLASEEWASAPPDLRPNVARYLDEPGDGLVILAEESGDVVGFAIVLAMPAPAEGAWQLYLDDVFVAEGHRRRGLGRALVEGMLSVARAIGAIYIHLHVRWDNVPARLLYESMGFEVAEAITYEWNAPED